MSYNILLGVRALFQPTKFSTRLFVRDYNQDYSGKSFVYIESFRFFFDNFDFNCLCCQLSFKKLFLPVGNNVFNWNPVNY